MDEKAALPEALLGAMSLPYPGQRDVLCYFMRGGSSRGGFFLEAELPADARERASLLLGVYGSPDIRQIDGLGGGDSLTSKAAVVGPSGRSGADVEFTFYQVGVDRPRVSMGGSCGNMLAAVGPFALLRGLVKPCEPETVIRIYTTNTRQVVTARVPVLDGVPRVDGSCAVAGVPGTGAAIALDFGNCAGTMTGRLLPTGSARDTIWIGGDAIDVSLVDATTPYVFVRARDIGAQGTEMPGQILANERLSATLERIRGWAARELGLVGSAEDAPRVTPNTPRVIMVSPAAAYRAMDGGEVSRGAMHLCVRQMSMQQPHRALAVTGAVCTAVAAAVEGTVVSESVGGVAADMRLGHPGGVLRVSSCVRGNAAAGYEVVSACVERTARLIMAGILFVSESKVRRLMETVEL